MYFFYTYALKYCSSAPYIELLFFYVILINVISGQCIILQANLSKITIYQYLTLSSLSTTIVVLNLFYWNVRSHRLGIKSVLKHHGLQMFGLKLSKYECFSQLEVVGRYRDPQLQVGKNLNYLI